MQKTYFYNYFKELLNVKSPDVIIAMHFGINRIKLKTNQGVSMFFLNDFSVETN